MKNKIKHSVKTILFISAALFVCFTLKAQPFYTQNFGTAGTPNLPSGWNTSQNFSLGWESDSSNASSGYTGASGVNHAVIKNSDSSGTYILTTGPISTINYKTLSVLFASRVTVHFLQGGSAYPTLAYSINAGTNWSNLSYTDNDTNSTWGLVNGGTQIPVPADAEDKADVRFRWSIQIVHSSSGTYRIDDFTIQGTMIDGIGETSSVNEIKAFPNPAVDFITLETKEQPKSLVTVTVTDLSGRILYLNEYVNLPFTLPCEKISGGIYFVAVSEENKILFRKKFIKQ